MEGTASMRSNMAAGKAVVRGAQPLLLPKSDTVFTVPRSHCYCILIPAKQFFYQQGRSLFVYFYPPFSFRRTYIPFRLAWYAVFPKELLLESVIHLAMVGHQSHQSHIYLFW